MANIDTRDLRFAKLAHGGHPGVTIYNLITADQDRASKTRLFATGHHPFDLDSACFSHALCGRLQTTEFSQDDLLTRNLGDFSGIVDVLDAAKANFVSITQTFNTTTSRGN